jgi:hypothetical protein
MAQLAADDVPRLKLKWAFCYPAASIAFAQPTIVAGRLFCPLGIMSRQRLNIGSRVTREGHARFWERERPEVKFVRATRQTSPFRG